MGVSEELGGLVTITVAVIIVTGVIGNVIGEGGFGITYIGRDLVLDTKVAVKEFYPAGHVNRNHAVTDELTISTDQQREFVKAGVERFSG